jgi:GNAT superfamily N-acetyltransferase
VTEPGSRPRRRTGREVRSLTPTDVADLPGDCDACLFWEHGPAGSSAPKTVDAVAVGERARKADWIDDVTHAWGPPGRIVFVDGDCAGYLTFAPPGCAPRTLAFPTAPIADDALALLTIRVRRRYAGQGLGRVLVQTACKDALRHDYRAIEAFGVTPALARRHRCMIPAGFLEAVGFETVRDHPAYPRMRLDLRSALGWRDDVERAFERIVDSIRGLRPAPPVGTAQQVPGPDSPPSLLMRRG